MSRRKFLHPVMAVLALLLCAQFPMRVSAFQEAAAASSKIDWPQFALTPDKTADNTAENILNTGNVSRLQLLFSTALPGGDNPDGAPVLLTDVSTANGMRDLIFVQGEHGHVSAFDANTGAVIWTKTFTGGSINNSAPAIDPNRQFVYVDTNDGFVHKLNVADGSEITTGGAPYPHGGGKGGSQLTIAVAANGHTYLYAANHGMGHITTIDLTTGAQHVFNASCSQFPDVQNPSGCTSTGARPWARGNPFIPALDRFFFMTGTNNGNGWNGCTMWKQSWLALPADGSTRLSGGCGFPADSYTPSNQAASVASDQDIGAGGLTPLPASLSSKFPHMGIQPGKDHNIRILNLDNLSGQGAPGKLGGELSLFTFSLSRSIRAQGAVWTNPADGKVWFFCGGDAGLHALTVNIDAAGNPSLTNVWNNQNGWTTSVVVANGVVYAAADGGEHTGSGAIHQVQAVDPTTGHILWTGQIGLFHWASPIVANGTVYMADGNSGGFSGPAGFLKAWRIPGGGGGQDFSIGATPLTQSVNAGSSAAYTVTVGASGGFTGSVNLGVAGLPTGATATFSTNPITGGSGSSTLTVATSSTTPAGTYTLTVSGSSTTPSLSHSTTVTLVVNGPPPQCVSASNGQAWVNTPFSAQTGTFTASFDVTPSTATIHGHVGLSNGAQNAYTGFATIVRFGDTGLVDARNGGAYAASTTLHYTAGATYHVRMPVNVPAHTYSIFVTPPGGSEVTIGSNFAFRTEQNTVTQLNNYGLFVAATTTNTLKVCNFTVQ